MSSLNTEQKQIIESFGQGQAVIAGAGCGKTTTLVAKCLALLAKNPKARFCAVSFTEKSVRDLKESLVKGFREAQVENALGGGGSQHWVKTIHGLCSSIIQEFPEASGLQGGERILLEDEAKRMWERSIHTLWSSSDNLEISEALDRLLSVYSRDQLENLFLKLRSLLSFGVDRFIEKNFDREEVKDLWFVFQSVHHRYAHAKNRAGALDFNDLEVFALRALKDPKVHQYFQTRFDLVLVDGFQDTNPLQGEILELFTKSDYSNLCIVGDPKQSIYRFRDADVSVFQDLAAKLPENHPLDTNYRSRPSIIEFVNEVCAPTFQAIDLPYESLKPGRIDEENVSRVSRLEIETEAELAQFLKSESERGVDLSEFVILVRSVRKDKTQKFLKALDDENIPFILGSGGRFYSDPRVQEIISFLRGWLSPKNTLSQVAFLRSTWVGVSDQTLYDWQEKEKDQYFSQFFREHTHPIALSLKDLYLSDNQMSGTRPGLLIEHLLKIEELDEELMIPLVSLWHRCEEQSSKGQRFQEVVNFLSQAMEEEKIEKEVPAPASLGMVRVMTIHSSKGLQFPRVIILDLEGEYKSMSNKADLIWDRKKGVHLFKRDQDGKREADDAENVSWTELEKRANVAESKRVFYVALTRAQEELLLVWKKEVKQSKASLAPGFNPHLSDNWRAWIEATKKPERRVFEAPVSSTIARKTVEKPKVIRMLDFDPKPYRPRHSPSEWMVLNQCELRYRKKFGMVSEEASTTNRELITSSDQEIEEVIARPETALKGEAIHLAIETKNWDAFIPQFQTRSMGEEILSRLKSFLREGESPEGIVSAYPELGFEVPLSPHQAVVGMMDRLEVNESAKTLRVIDYKFTAKPKTASELLTHYALQLRLYTWASAKLVNFKPAKVEAFLVHFTEKTMEIIEAPGNLLNLSEIESDVQALFEKALKMGDKPTLGDYCRYCEFTHSCPAFQNSVQK